MRGRRKWCMMCIQDTISTFFIGPIHNLCNDLPRNSMFYRLIKYVYIYEWEVLMICNKNHVFVSKTRVPIDVFQNSNGSVTESKPFYG